MGDNEYCENCGTDMGISYALTVRIVAFLRRPSEDGVECSVEREMLAAQIERGEHQK